MKKLLFIPLDYHVRPHQDWFNAFKKYFNVMYYSNQQVAMHFKPDFIFVQSSALEVSKMVQLKETNPFIMQWTGDCRPNALPEVVNYRDVSDVAFLAVGIAQKEMYEKELGQPVYYLQHAVTKEQFRPVINNEAGRIIFIGNYYDQFPGGKERNELCELLTKEFSNFVTIGNGYSEKHRSVGGIKYEFTPQAYNEAFVSISANIYNDYEGYHSNRPLDIMAAGGCCLMRYTPKMENYFKDGEHCIFYRSNQEALEKIKSLTVEDRNRIARTGQQFVIDYHTYEYRVIEMMHEINHLL